MQTTPMERCLLSVLPHHHVTTPPAHSGDIPPASQLRDDSQDWRQLPSNKYVGNILTVTPRISIRTILPNPTSTIFRWYLLQDPIHDTWDFNLLYMTCINFHNDDLINCLSCNLQRMFLKNVLKMLHVLKISF